MDTGTDRTRRGARRRRLTAGLPATLLAWALMGTTSPATAGDTLPNQVVLIDGPGDVWRLDPHTDQYVKVSKPPADVTRATVRYGHHAVILRMRFVNLRRVGIGAMYGYELRTGRHQYPLGVLTWPGAWRGKLSYGFNSYPDWGPCAGVTHSVDYDNELVRVRLPRRCLGWPAWVRVRFYNEFANEYYDNPHNHLVGSSSLTPRIYRG